jgi:hypothetical protein
MFSVPSPFGRGLGEGLAHAALLTITLREMISLLSEIISLKHSSVTFGLSPHPQPFSQREKGG